MHMPGLVWTTAVQLRRGCAPCLPGDSIRARVPACPVVFGGKPRLYGGDRPGPLGWRALRAPHPETVDLCSQRHRAQTGDRAADDGVLTRAWACAQCASASAPLLAHLTIMWCLRLRADGACLPPPARVPVELSVYHTGRACHQSMHMLCALQLRRRNAQSNCSAGLKQTHSTACCPCLCCAGALSRTRSRCSTNWLALKQGTPQPPPPHHWSG